MGIMNETAPAVSTLESRAVRAPAFSGGPEISPPEAGVCHHCGTPCPDNTHALGEKLFCCQGCQVVYELLSENGLGQFYDLSPAAGNRITSAPAAGRFRYLDDPAVRQRLITYSDGRISRVRFHVPAMHCLACVWLLENLFRFHPGLGQSRVNFPRKEVSISFEESKIPLSQVVELLASIGYEPDLKLADLDQPRPAPTSRKLWLQLGVAGFAFGNIMLLSFPAYLGLDSQSGPALKHLFGYISLLLALPVFLYSASDYWRSAWRCITRRMLTIDFPIALGIAALFGLSAFEILSGRGEGYCDSLAGLLFFLLCGKVFQQKTYDRLSFDRDYKSFFPLSVIRKRDNQEAPVSLSELQVGDRLVLRHGELVPADAILIHGPGAIDYSFVTGESEPVVRQTGEYLYAGGQQAGGAIEVEIVKPVSQSYLTSLWNHEAFRKQEDHQLQSLTNLVSRYFTLAVLAIAAGTALFWFYHEPARAVTAFTSVLVVACPCALALAAPFALGTAQRALARRNIFVKNPLVLETMARATAIVFDKTGTLTRSTPHSAGYQGAPLTPDERRSVYSLARQSTHPLCVRISQTLGGGSAPQAVDAFQEIPGCGVEGRVHAHELWLGSRAWLDARGAAMPATAPQTNEDTQDSSSAVCLAIDGQFRGVFSLGNALRPRAGRMLAHLARDYELALLSGDHAKAREEFQALFGREACLRFNQNPFHKLEFIRELQRRGNTVMMVGDGLNDAGALKQSNVGVAVVESIGAFSPASDVILEAARVPRLEELLRFSKAAARIVRLSFLISFLYNVIGLSFAARGLLSPIISAILMPLSSITVVVFACGATHWRGRRLGAESPLEP